VHERKKKNEHAEFIAILSSTRGPAQVQTCNFLTTKSESGWEKRVGVGVCASTPHRMFGKVVKKLKKHRLDKRKKEERTAACHMPVANVDCHCLTHKERREGEERGGGGLRRREGVGFVHKCIEPVVKRER
jgi:hypothetical protein